VWLGHSSWYLQLAGKRILIDPVLSNYAAPFSFMNKAFAGSIRGARKACRRSTC
jgi:L-ascorbate metabolism protein UlaG (beta-lactamase superfamily)